MDTKPQIITVDVTPSVPVSTNKEFIVEQGTVHGMQFVTTGVNEFELNGVQVSFIPSSNGIVGPSINTLSVNAGNITRAIDLVNLKHHWFSGLDRGKSYVQIDDLINFFAQLGTQAIDTTPIPEQVDTRMVEVSSLVGAGHFKFSGTKYVEVHRDAEDSVTLYHHPDWPNNK